MAAVPECVERPDHAGRTEVQRRDATERRLVGLLVEGVGRPELVGVECLLRLRDDRGDRRACPVGVPGGLGEGLVGVRVDERREARRVAAHRRATNTYSVLASSNGSPAKPP